MPQERITITIDTHLLNQIDLYSKKNNLRNRSNTISALVAKALPQASIKMAVVLVGGRGVEQSSQHIISVMKKLLEYKIEKFVIVYGHYGQSIKDILQAENDFRDKLTFSYTDLGSGGGLKQVAELLPPRFVLVNIQEKIKLDCESLLNYQQTYNAKITLQISHGQRGVAIVSKSILDQIPDQFSIIEEDILPKLQKSNEIIYLP